MTFRKKPKTKTFEIPELSGQELIKMHFLAHSAIEDLLWRMVILGDSRYTSCFDKCLCFNFNHSVQLRFHPKYHEFENLSQLRFNTFRRS